MWLWGSQQCCLYACRFQMLSALSLVPESASPGHFYRSAFGHQGHLSASSEPGNGWRTLGTSTCPKSRVWVPTANITLQELQLEQSKGANTPGGEAGGTDPDGLQDTTSPQLLHCPLLIKPRQEQKLAVGCGTRLALSGGPGCVHTQERSGTVGSRVGVTAGW